MKPDGTLFLKRHEIATLLNIEECIEAVEQAFRLYAEGKTTPPGILGIHTRDGGFHIKAGLLELGRTYFAAKANANFPQNMSRFGLPLIQGVIVLCDGESGYPLALMDSIEITIIRTGAATGVATKYLARTDAHVATICGCGNQGRISLKAIAKVRDLSRAYAWDIDQNQARRFADELSKELNVEVRPDDDLAAAVGESDICVTCTPTKEYFQVHAELGEVITGKKAGRGSEEEIIIFDSTGTALQDVAAAAIVYERAVSARIGTVMNLAE